MKVAIKKSRKSGLHSQRGACRMHFHPAESPHFVLPSFGRGRFSRVLWLVHPVNGYGDRTEILRLLRGQNEAQAEFTPFSQQLFHRRTLVERQFVSLVKHDEAA